MKGLPIPSKPDWLEWSDIGIAVASSLITFGGSLIMLGLKNRFNKK